MRINYYDKLGLLVTFGNVEKVEVLVNKMTLTLQNGNEVHLPTENSGNIISVHVYEALAEEAKNKI